jgi:serine/threonine protein kinase/tetratricopeptide (TPR) repeat protein
MSSPHPDTNGQVLRQYRILGQLGRGGMGTVFLAEDTVLQRKVALKFLPSEAAVESSGRSPLLREARAAARLGHPYICKVHEIGEAGGRQFIAMEYVEGNTLRDTIAKGPLHPDLALQFAIEIAEALENAHQHGTIHRDLKPANVMVSSSGHVKVMDFGLAIHVLSDARDDAATATVLTQPGTISGTLAYMSPEQLRGSSLDGRSDIFALGVILYEMLTGAHPFQKGTTLDTASAILKDAPPPISGNLGGLARIDEILAKMLAKDRDQRYADARRLLDDLVQARLQGQTGTATARRSPLARRPVLALISLAAMVLAGIYWFFIHTPSTVLAFRSRDWILIADFENLTGEEVFNESLDAALSVGIEQSKYVNVFPHSRIPETLRRMGYEQTRRIDEKVAREVAVREGIKGLLLCSIARVGDTYSLTAQLVDPNTQFTALTEIARASSRNEVLVALDDLAKRVRKKLGDSLSGISSPAMPLPRATTASLEALRLFAMARSEKRDSNATALLEQAVQLDPDFAMAHASLGVAYYIGDRRELGERHFQQALKRLDRLTLREQLWIQAVVADWRGDREGAIDRYEAFVAQYPDFFEGWFRLGWTRMITRRHAAAIEAFRKALVINPSAGAAYINIATCYSAMQNYTDSIANYQKAFELNPSELYGSFVNHEYGFVLVRTGQVAKAEENFRVLLARDNDGKARGNRSLALLRMYQGKYAAAIPFLKEAILLTQALNGPASELRNRLYLARVYRAKGMTAAFDEQLRAAGQLYAKNAFSPDWAYHLGKMFARAGKIKEAAAVLNRAEKSVNDTVASSPVNRDTRRDRAFVEVLKGEVELAGSKSPHAAEVLELANRLFPDPTTLEPLAHAASTLGNLEEAARKYEEIAAAPQLGAEAQEDWILAHYELGRIFQKAGDRAKAEDYYQKFLAIWKDGDPDLPSIVDAKAQLIGQASSAAR